jgi:hypothetical protein
VLKWDVEKKREGKDNHIPSLFLRNIIELGDAIAILIRKSSIDPCKNLIRSLYENCLSILYILEENEDERAHCFMVWKAKRDLKYYKQFITSNQSSKELKAKLRKDHLKLKLEKYFREVVHAKISLLKQDKFKEVAIEYERTTRSTKNPNWHSLFNGPRNFQELSYYFKKTIEYEFQYRKYSENVHATGLLKGFADAGDDKVQIIQIRDFENSKDIYIGTVSYLLIAYNEIILKRIPEQRDEFLKWHLSFRDVNNNTIRDKQFVYRK